jgi:hypothetical protein
VFRRKRRDNDNHQPTAALCLEKWIGRDAERVVVRQKYKGIRMMTSTQKNRRYYQTRMTFSCDDDVVECVTQNLISNLFQRENQTTNHTWNSSFALNKEFDTTIRMNDCSFSYGGK